MYRIHSFFLGSLLLVAPFCQASLIGDDVEIQWYFPDLASPVPPQFGPFTVEAGLGDAQVEGAQDITLNVEASSLHIIFDPANGPIEWLDAVFNGPVFMDLDWVGMPAAVITGVDVAATVPVLDNVQLISSHRQLARIVRDWTPQEGIQGTAIAGVELIRSDAPTSCGSSVYEPSLCFVIQGTKSIQLGDREIVYGPLTYLASSVHLPVLGQIMDATPEQPYLAAKLTVNPQEVADLVLELGDSLYNPGLEMDCPEVACAWPIWTRTCKMRSFACSACWIRPRMFPYWHPWRGGKSCTVP